MKYKAAMANNSAKKIRLARIAKYLAGEGLLISPSGGGDASIDPNLVAMLASIQRKINSIKSRCAFQCGEIGSLLQNQLLHLMSLKPNTHDHPITGSIMCFPLLSQFGSQSKRISKDQMLNDFNKNKKLRQLEFTKIYSNLIKCRLAITKIGVVEVFVQIIGHSKIETREQWQEEKHSA